MPGHIIIPLIIKAMEKGKTIKDDLIGNQPTAGGKPLPKDIPPTIDAIDDYIKEHKTDQMGEHRSFLMRCINRLVNPTKEFDKNHIYDSWGYPIAKRCYASKRWCPLDGPKGVKFHGRRNHKSGLNKMSIEGRKVWENELKKYNKAKEEAVKKHEVGQISHDEMLDEIAKAADNRVVAFRDWQEGFATMEQCMAYLKKYGLLV